MVSPYPYQPPSTGCCTHFDSFLSECNRAVIGLLLGRTHLQSPECPVSYNHMSLSCSCKPAGEIATVHASGGLSVTECIGIFSLNSGLYRYQGKWNKSQPDIINPFKVPECTLGTLLGRRLSLCWRISTTTRRESSSRLAEDGKKLSGAGKDINDSGSSRREKKRHRIGV